MATTAASRAMTMTALRTGLSCSFLSSSAGFLALGTDEEDDEYLRNQVHALEFLHPRPPDELIFTSVWNKWTPDAPYKVYPSAIGGCWPYVWTLIDEPSGMTIQSVMGDITDYDDRAAHGRIDWPTPVAGDYVFYVRCTSQDGKCITQRVELNVATDNARFVSPSGTDSTAAAGTKASPFQKIANWYGGSGGTGVSGDRADTTYANKIMIFRAGTYTVPVDEGGGNLNMGANKPCTWVAYDGETVVLDLSSSGIRFASNSAAGTRNRVEFIGMTTKYEDTTQNNTFQMFVSMENDSGGAALAGHLIICDHTIDSWKNHGAVGNDNAGGIVGFDPDPNWYRKHQYRNIRIVALGGGVQGTSGTQDAPILSMRVWGGEYNNITTVSQSGDCNTILKWKHRMKKVVARACYLVSTSSSASSTFAMQGGGGTGGDMVQAEFCALSLPLAAEGANSGSIRVGSNTSTETSYGATWVRRCTIFGARPQLTNWDESAADSTFIEGANVLECTDWSDSATAWTGAVTEESSSVQATSGVVDASGVLEGSYRTTYLGKKGWELAS